MSWDPYIEKQLYHLVVALDFDFDRITEELLTICRALNRKPFSLLDCRIKWAGMHSDRQHNTGQKVKMQRIQRCVEAFQNPVDHMTVDELIERLPSTRRNQDFLSNAQQKQFNVITDSVRGAKDAEERLRQQREKEALFLQQLDSLQAEPESEKPLIYKAEYDEQGRLIVKKHEFTQEDVMRMLSQKVDMGKGIPTGPLVDENYVSQFAQRKPEEPAPPVQTTLAEDTLFMHLYIDAMIISDDIPVDDAVRQLNQLQEMVPEVHDDELPEQLVSSQPRAMPVLSQIANTHHSESEDEDDFLESQRYQLKDEKPPEVPARKPAKLQQEEEGDAPNSPLYPQPKFDAAIRFREQLIKEQRDREERKRQQELQAIEEIEKNIKEREDFQERLRREAKQQEIDRKTQELALRKREDEERLKQYQIAELDKRLRQYEEEYEQSQLLKIQQKNQQIVASLSLEPLQCFFNPQVSYNSQVAGIDSETQAKIQDIDLYESSPDGITNRYQILVLPYFDRIEYVQEVLSFFLVNSSVRADPIIHRAGFPFSLMSFFVGNLLGDTLDPGSDVFVPAYLKKELATEKHLYLFFDTHQGRGAQILQTRIEALTLRHILLPSTITRLQKQHDINESTRIVDFCVTHIKQMSEVSRTFLKLHTMHQLKSTRTAEYSFIIVREYEEVIEVVNPHSTIGTTLDFVTETGYGQPHAVKSNLNYLLHNLHQHNLQIIGIRVVYLTQTNIHELAHSDLHLKAEHPLIVIAVQGNTKKLPKLIGCEDPQLARQTYPNSVNALYHRDKHTSVIFPVHQSTAIKLISFFFAGRLQKVQTIEQVKRLDGIIREEIKYFTCPLKTPTMFLLDQRQPKHHCIVLSPSIGVSLYAQFVKYIQKKGFSIQSLRTVPAVYLEGHLGPDFNYRVPNDQGRSNVMIVDCIGTSLQSVRRSFLLKHLDYNFMLHPSKKSLIYVAEKGIPPVVFMGQRTPVFTSNANFAHYVLAVSKAHLDSEHIGATMALLCENHLELLGVFECPAVQQGTLRSTLWRSLNLSNVTKRRKEPQTFCDRLIDSLTTPILAFFRQQNKEQLLPKLSKELLNSNLQLEEWQIIRQGEWVPPAFEMPRVLFLPIQHDQLQEYANNFDLCDDVTLKDSFIFDLPELSQGQAIRSVVLLEEGFVKSLSLGGILKQLAKEQLHVELIRLGQVPKELEYTVLMGLHQKLNLTAQNDIEKHNLAHQLESELSNRIARNRFYMFLVDKPNGIFETKSIVQDLTFKYALLSKEEVGPSFQDIVRFQLTHGVYCSVDYEASIRESDVLQRVRSEPRIGTPLQNSGQRLVMLVSCTTGLHDLVQDILSNQIRIEEIAHNDTREMQPIYELLHDKFGQQALSKCLTSQLALTVLILEVSKVLSISDMFGSSRVTSEGEWQYTIEGKLVKRKQVEFYVTTYQNQPSIEKFRNSYFSQ